VEEKERVSNLLYLPRENSIPSVRERGEKGWQRKRGVCGQLLGLAEVLQKAGGGANMRGVERAVLGFRGEIIVLVPFIPFFLSSHL